MKILFLVLIFLVPLSLYLLKDTYLTKFIPSPVVEDLPIEKEVTFAVKTPHFVESTPEHDSVLPAAPLNIVIDFNFDLAKESSISIKRNNQEFSQGLTIVASNKLSMRKVFDTGAPDGLYTVAYKACWPDKTCHNGSFQFRLDRTAQNAFQDMRGRKEIIINMLEDSFETPMIRVSKGTRITWLNNSDREHYINTDPHPGHNYFPEQNSKLLKPKEKYSLELTKSGFYPYHCSVHAGTMKAQIIVD